MAELIGTLPDRELKLAEKTSMPGWMEPMLARLTHDPFSDEKWIYERKLDGERALSFISPHGGAKIMSRNRKRIDSSYPEIRKALQGQSPRGCILDGEVVAFADDGTSDFQKLQPRMQADSPEEAKLKGLKVFYYVFDCLYVDGHDITGCSLRRRKILLRKALNWSDPLRFTPHRNEDGMEYYRQACEKGWEGLIAKKADSPYTHGRSGSWFKFKCLLRQEFVIGGFTDPGGDRRGFGALLIGFYEGSRLVYAGRVGTGFDNKTLKGLGKRLSKLKRDTSPFSGEPEQKANYVTPELVCEVAFTGWTSDSLLRHPAYKGLRRDKDPREVTREDADPAVDRHP